MFVSVEADTDKPEVELQPGMRILGNDDFRESIVLVFSNLWKEKEAKATKGSCKRQIRGSRS